MPFAAELFRRWAIGPDNSRLKLSLQNKRGDRPAGGDPGEHSHKVLINEGEVCKNLERAWNERKQVARSPIEFEDVVIWGGTRPRDGKETDSQPPRRWVRVLVFDKHKYEVLWKSAVEGSYYSKLMATLAIANSELAKGTMSSQSGLDNCDSIFSTDEKVTELLRSRAKEISMIDSETAGSSEFGVASIVHTVITE